MSELYRFGIAVEKDLIEEFDRTLRACGYDNRSEAIRDLIRQFVIEEASQKSNATVAGAIIMVYDHTKRDLPERLTDFQHHHKEIISTMHIHLDEKHCLEIVAIRGSARVVKRIADSLLAKKGVLFGKYLSASLEKKGAKK